MLNKINLIGYYLFKYPLYKILFGKIGSSSRIVNSKIDGYSRIFIGSKVYLNAKGWLAAVPLTGDVNCKLVIGSYTYVGHFSHFYATSKIEIGKKVLIANNVYISDNQHGYKNILLPVIDQPIKQLKAVIIGDGAWIGENVCIIGASVGKNSVIGANAVVLKDIPDYCVAVGAPAKIIKRYNFDLNDWQNTDVSGNFI